MMATEEDEPTVKYSILLPKSIHKAVKQAALDHNRSMQDILRRAVYSALAEITSVEAVPKSEQTEVLVPQEQNNSTETHQDVIILTDARERKWVNRFLYVLRRGQPQTVAAIVSNVQEFAEKTHLVTREAMPSDIQAPFDASQSEADKLRAVEELLRETENAERFTRETRTPGYDLQPGPKRDTG